MTHREITLEQAREVPPELPQNLRRLLARRVATPASCACRPSFHPAPGSSARASSGNDAKRVCFPRRSPVLRLTAGAGSNT